MAACLRLTLVFALRVSGLAIISMPCALAGEPMAMNTRATSSGAKETGALIQLPLSQPLPKGEEAATREQLRRETREAIKASMQVTAENRQGVVHRLVELHKTLAESTLPARQRAPLAQQVRNRLEQLAQLIDRQLQREAKAPTNVNVRNPVLAQQAFGFGGAAVNPARRPPRQVVPVGNAVQQNDNGRALVELIQRTIAPQSWDVNGGLGSIVYFRPMRVLVVRQRSEVQEQLQDVVRGLRR